MLFAFLHGLPQEVAVSDILLLLATTSCCVESSAQVKSQQVKSEESSTVNSQSGLSITTADWLIL